MHTTFVNPHYSLSPPFSFLQMLDTEFKVGLKVQKNFAVYQFGLYVNTLVFYLLNKPVDFNF